MWIFTNLGMISIVADRNNPDHLLVRAREKGTIEALFSVKKVKETKSADYRFRLSIPAGDVGKVLAEHI
jgi:hypothetical protein